MTITPIKQYTPKELATSQIIDLGNAANAVESLSIHTLTDVRLQDGSGEMLNGYTALRRIALALLDMLHAIDNRHAMDVFKEKRGL